MTKAKIMRSREHDPGDGTLLQAATLIGPVTIFVAAGVLLPLAILLRYSFNQFVPGQFMVEAVTLDNYLRFFSDPYYGGVLLRTVRISLICTVICLAVGFPLAYMLARTETRYKSLLILAIVLPLFVGNAVRAAGWMVAFGTRGFFNYSLSSLGLIDAPLEIMYTERAVVIGIVAVNLPFVVLSLQTVLEGISRSIEEAAFNLGAKPLTMARRVLWPLALPGIISGATLCFILTMNAYATPVLLGGPKFMMMGPLVYSQVVTQMNWPFGASASFILMGATLLLTVAGHLIVHRRYSSRP
jgi:putative spermidine/putrescine transport system permease protein